MENEKNPSDHFIWYDAAATGLLEHRDTMKHPVAMFCLVILTTDVPGQEPSGLNASKLPPLEQPIEPIIIRDGQLHRSPEEADAAEEDRQVLLNEMKRTSPVADKESRPPDRRLLYGGIVIGGLIGLFALRALVFRKPQN